MPDETSDDTLWTLLRAQTVGERVPTHVRDAARESLSWRDPDAALAALVADTSDDETEADLFAHVRGTGQPRLLTFTTEALTIEVEADRRGQVVSLVGQLVPAGQVAISVDHRGGVATVAADELGRFQVNALTPGPVRLRCAPHPAGGAPVHTDWVLL